MKQMLSRSKKYRMSTTFLFTLFALSKGVTSLAVITPSQINVTLNSNSTVVLNCTFDVKTNATLVRVSWKKERGSVYTELVEYDFSVRKIVYFKKDFQKRSNSSIGRNSTSFICVINDVRCEDDGNYRCSVTFDEVRSRSTRESNSTVYIQAKAEVPFNLSLQPNHNVEENNVFNVTCMARVGDPQGKVTLWKRRNPLDQRPYLLEESSVSENRKENCSIVSQLTVPLNLTRDDQGVYIECSLKDHQTEDSTLIRQIGPLDIFYGPSNVSIELSPPEHNCFVGERIRLTCSSDGNPRPNFQWMFNFTEIVNGEKYHLLDQDTTLEFNIASVTDSGYYDCFASNSFNGNLYNSNDRIMLIVQDKDIYSSTARKSCLNIHCSFIEKCTTKDNIGICSLNIWKIVALLFISCSLILGTTTVILWRYLKLRNLRTILDKMIIRNGEDRSYETLSSGTTHRGFEERNYESLSNRMADAYSSIDESALRYGGGAHYESLGSGETHTYSSIQPTVSM